MPPHNPPRSPACPQAHTHPSWGGSSMQNCAAVPPSQTCLIQSCGEGSGGQGGWGSIPGCTPCADTCLLQELIYKEFFSQGDLVRTT